MNKFNMNFYDIESLGNVFTLANFKERQNHIDLFILCDTPEILQTQGQPFHSVVLDRIYQRNHNFNGTLSIFDLTNEEDCKYLAKTFGLSNARIVNRPNNKSEYPNEFRPVCDTDPEYNEDLHPYFCGYNSTNYDTTMLAQFLYEVFMIDESYTSDDPQAKLDPKKRMVFRPTTAKYMREVNDDLFTSTFKDNMPTYLARDKNMRTGVFGPANYSNSRWKIRKSMLMTGRQIDASNLNEKQKKVALKRQLGMSGYQILESDKLDDKTNIIHNLDELLDLIAYNVSDVVNLAKQFENKLYQGQFTLKRQLLKTYPELIYEKKEDSYTPDIDPNKVRNDRLFIDSTSSQLAQKTLCPYEHLKDIQAVSFLYPHPDKAAELGIPVVNVLDKAKKFFYDLYPQSEVRAEFDEIYEYYKSIEGKNFNESDNYLKDWGANALPVYNINQIPKRKNCIPYFDKEGNPTSCFATFSTGGVHGAEYNYELFHADLKVWEDFKADMDYVQSQYPDPVVFRQTCGTKPKEVDLPNGETVTMTCFRNAAKHLLSLSEEERKALTLETPKKKTVQLAKTLQLLYHNDEDINAVLNQEAGIKMPDGRQLPVTYFLKNGKKVEESEYKDVESGKPELFKISDKDSWKLNPAYVFTSCAEANHEDFTSYYPNLLRMMKAFFNPGLGYDRYAEVFQNKQDYGFLMKEKNQNLTPEKAELYRKLREETKLPLQPLHISKEERALYDILRDGTKLILNSASGAGDATFDNNIRMNNAIISMRIIGQIFSWRIGQAQAYQGANIISTNTDGLYSVMEATLNNQILEKESATIGVEIEPEPLFLISKDTNNRLELNIKNFGITAASGGTLACRKGPRPDKSLAHPAIIDWALAEYLTVAAQGYKGLALDKPFNETIGMNILKSAAHKHDPVTFMRLFQNVIASSPGSVRYIYGVTKEAPNTPIMLQHYNRIFYMKDDTPNTIQLWAACARVITDATKRKRIKNNEIPVVQEPIPVKVLKHNGVTSMPLDKDITQTKVSGIDPDWQVFVQNKDLSNLTMDEFNFLMNNLNYDHYLTLLKDCFEKNWRNILPYRHYMQFVDMNQTVRTETIMNNRFLMPEQFPIPSGQKFKEWNTLPDGTGEKILPCFTPEKDMTVYAIYETV